MQSVKKKFFLIAFVLACIVFHKAIVGTAVRWVLQARADCEMAYRSIHWDEGELVFSDLVIFDPTFHAHIEKVAFRFDWSAFPQKLKGHITLDHPHVSVMKKRSIPDLKEGWLDFTFCVHDGTIEWDGLAHFSYIDNRLALCWQDASAILVFSEDKVEAEFNQFKAKLLKSFMPFGEITSGQLTGRVHANMDRELIAANLKVENGGVAFPLGSIENGEGSLSYNASLGAKWELKGIGSAQEKKFPFVWEGRGFFNSRWIESDIRFDDASCRISGVDAWKIECRRLASAEATLLQACSVSFLPQLANWTFAEGILNGVVNISSDSWNATFEGERLSFFNGKQKFVCRSAKGDLSQEGGQLKLADELFDLNIEGTWTDWKADARVLTGIFTLQGGWDGEKFPIQIAKGQAGDFEFAGQGWIDPHFDLSFSLDGLAQIFQKQIPFHCPHFSKHGSEWAFDFRLARKTWDVLRVVGTSNGQEVLFDPKSQLLGAPLHFEPRPLGEVDVHLQLPWKSVMAAGLFLKEWGLDVEKIPFSGDTDIHLQYKNSQPKVHAKAPSFELHAEYSSDVWEIGLTSDLVLNGTLQKDGKVKGSASWKTGLDAEFEGEISPQFRCELTIPKARVDLAQFEAAKMEGILEGQGHFIYDSVIEADFDFLPTSLKISSHCLDNEGPVHVYYSSSKGAVFRGVKLHGPLDCIVDLLEYDTNRSHWIFHNAQVHLPGSFLTHRFLQFLDKDHDLNFTADLDFASDFSTFVCTMREGLIPFDGASHHIENLHLCWHDGECKAALHYLDHLHRIVFNVDEKIAGRLTLGEEEPPLTIDWEYEDALAIHSIEGSFGGLEASFHAESPNSLIGSARVNFTALSQLLPTEVAEVFEEIKMGKGYELKGKLKIKDNVPHFQGILAGKQLELFGFQFRTLLAQVDLGPELIRIYDLKISDTAGTMKIDDIRIAGKADQPWTIAIPQLTMIDLRPSLLQRPGGPVGPISPLVVRELKLTDFKGLLDDGKTYTANGKLHFINSYKREETVFDLPVNILSRIVGIDLELLIPICGDLDFNLKDGYFTLTELTNAFSEGNRSEFFLEMDPPPTMDLDGNLEIFVKMKQFVLLKLTESFLISIDGQLDDPQFHLQKKRFFGLM